MMNVKTIANRLYIFVHGRYTNSSEHYHGKQKEKVIEALNFQNKFKINYCNPNLFQKKVSKNWRKNS